MDKLVTLGGATRRLMHHVFYLLVDGTEMVSIRFTAQSQKLIRTLPSPLRPK